MNQQPSAISNLHSLTNRLLLISAVLLFTSLFIGIILLVLSKQQLKKVASLRQEMQSFEQSQVNTASLRDFIRSQGENIDLLLQVFPHQDNIVDFLTALELLVQSYDEKAKVTFSVLNPTKVNNELAIPLAITLQVSPQEVVDLLRRIETLPYIVKITTVSINSPAGLQATADVTLGGRVYVQDPFYTSDNAQLQP